MNYPSKQDLEIFLRRQNNRCVTALGMKIKWIEKNGIMGIFVHRTYDQGPWEIAVATEFDDLGSFTTEFNCNLFKRSTSSTIQVPG